MMMMKGGVETDLRVFFFEMRYTRKKIDGKKDIHTCIHHFLFTVSSYLVILVLTLLTGRLNGYLPKIYWSRAKANDCY